jgi:hypothetical protein
VRGWERGKVRVGVGVIAISILLFLVEASSLYPLWKTQLALL